MSISHPAYTKLLLHSLVSYLLQCCSLPQKEKKKKEKRKIKNKVYQCCTIFWASQKALWLKRHHWQHYRQLPTLPMQYIAKHTQNAAEHSNTRLHLQDQKWDFFFIIFIFCPKDPLNLETILRTMEDWEKDHFGSAFLPHLPLQLLLCANARRPVQLISWGHNEPARAAFLAQRS